MQCEALLISWLRSSQRRFAVEERVGTLTSFVFYQKHPAHSKPRIYNVKKAGPHSIRFAEGDDHRTDLIFGHFASRQSAKEVAAKVLGIRSNRFVTARVVLGTMVK